MYAHVQIQRHTMTSKNALFNRHHIFLLLPWAGFLFNCICADIK